MVAEVGHLESAPSATTPRYDCVPVATPSNLP
ncbi:hypothetical protein L915_20190 [Phytophthora nicotianae]|uniref:Uncharacterized protein n=1 Tax=Phytophthora nicotianae TaxID=4792 RepID=W2FRU2_PHYNI|nr:hypothetical protein L915_20190 [Phytophthora nicotianae]ETL25662.1 hypothetical protein L916_20547 [Phytophthora nicotianae]ETM32716.1 hypothetical protein L914_19951 [Phytophthora nicotianae]